MVHISEDSLLGQDRMSQVREHTLSYFHSLSYIPSLCSAPDLSALRDASEPLILKQTFSYLHHSISSPPDYFKVVSFPSALTYSQPPYSIAEVVWLLGGNITVVKGSGSVLKSSGTVPGSAMCNFTTWGNLFYFSVPRLTHL